jgi:hypothetical protein
MWKPSVAAALLAGAAVIYSQSAGTASASGVEVPIPNGWHWNQAIAQQGGPLSLTSFEHWDSGGVPPADGAEIDITRVPAPRNLQEYVQREIEGSQAEPLVESAIQKNPAVEAAFTDTYGDLKLATHALYVLRGSRMYKLYLTFHAGDAHAADFLATFHDLAQRSKFE